MGHDLGRHHHRIDGDFPALTAALPPFSNYNASRQESVMKIAVPAEGDQVETRVAATPETVKKFIALGAEVTVQSGAGAKSFIPDAEFQAAGASLSGSTADAVRDADIVLAVRRPGEAVLKALKPGALVIATMDPYGNEAALKAMADAGVSGFAMELMPRITRAQVMDVLSSQANLAGYQAVIDAADAYGRALPMMMTAAGTVPAARVFVMGAGVAGLQAIATARRLGAVVTATDVRPAAKEQVESLAAKFIAVEDEEFKQAETAAGYAKPMSAEYQAKQAALIADHIKKQDIVITTALIPGRPAPRLVTKDMLASMRPGSVVVDLAVERGGNVEGARAGEVATVGQVKVVGHLNVAGRIPASASALYARNLYAFVETLIDKAAKSVAVNWDDELVKATLLTRDRAVVHPAFAAKETAA
jgi:NAD(P) transhydrogenase subunit alpha